MALWRRRLAWSFAFAIGTALLWGITLSPPDPVTTLTSVGAALLAALPLGLHLVIREFPTGGERDPGRLGAFLLTLLALAIAAGTTLERGLGPALWGLPRHKQLAVVVVATIVAWLCAALIAYCVVGKLSYGR